MNDDRTIDGTAVDENGQEIGAFMAELARKSADAGDTPALLLGGTFAMYSIPDRDGGGIMVVMDDDSGLFGGPQHTRIPPHMVRAMLALSNGDKIGAAKALLGRGASRKAIGGRS